MRLEDRDAADTCARNSRGKRDDRRLPRLERGLDAVPAHEADLDGWGFLSERREDHPNG